MATIDDVRQLLAKGYDPRSTVTKLGQMLAEEKKPEPAKAAEPEKKRSLLRKSKKSDD
jgi:hypothetical protein